MNFYKKFVIIYEKLILCGDLMNEAKKVRLKRLILFTLLAFIVGLTIYLIYELTGLGFKCIFYEVTGFKCAGCGNTHFVGSILKFNIKEAFSYNYLFPLEAFYIAWVYFFSAKQYLNGKKFNYFSPFRPLDITILILLLVWVPVRNIFGF